ncbi:DNA repair protein complementing XP-A cells homolog [Cylas formicarius]|uniref:DNA repair protein complementing XP-A cells homolog n=1 Tax=Cylas formicarius TaxID=197179 RepID=UPI00295885E4|nr:DNA repair protein complementing XP-A cells homolog [Cylas formicarius]
MSAGDEDLPHYLRKRIEKNRLKAVALKNTKLVCHPYFKGDVSSVNKTTITVGNTKFKDTGGGFLLEEHENEPEESEYPLVQAEAPIIEPDRPECVECAKPFATSWLFEQFDCRCCDECKEQEKYKFITKTEAKTKYLLQDCDFDKREPPLKCIKRKNPHNVRWGEMKLYLEIQVEARAIEIWGTEEKIEEEKERREEKKVQAKMKKHNKQLKELRMNMRSSLYDKSSGRSHSHEFGPESYNEQEDTYTRCCTTCPYEETFEKI